MPAVGVIDTNTLNSLNGVTGANTAKKKDVADELSTNFMTLLVTQLKNQDPMNPLENNELTSQLAQINTVGGIDKLNQTMQGIDSQIAAGQSIQAAGLIGKSVMVPGNRVLLGSEGAATPFGVELESATASLKANIVDANGIVLRTYDLGAQNKGVANFSWDGELENGERVAPGAYRINFEARDASDALVQATSLNFATVSGVVNNGGAPRLDLGGINDSVSLQDIRQIL